MNNKFFTLCLFVVFSVVINGFINFNKPTNLSVEIINDFLNSAGGKENILKIKNYSSKGVFRKLNSSFKCNFLIKQ